jgi:signal transduction histidine kinase
LDPSQYFELREKEISEKFQGRIANNMDKKSNADNANDSLPSLSQEQIERISPLLLLENDESLCDSIYSILGKLGINVYKFKDFEEAKNKVSNIISSKQDIKMAIIDPNLDAKNMDLSGMKIIMSLEAISNCHILLMTGEAEDNRKLNDWGKLKVNSLLHKPFTIRQLLETIDEASVFDSMDLGEWIKIEKNSIEHETNKAPEINTVETSSVIIKNALDELTSIKLGTFVHVFEIHPRSFYAKSIANAGGNINWVPLRGKIGKSRIKDAAFSNKPIIENVKQNERAHLWTREMVYYESFCGIPLGRIGDKLYTLVAFNKHEDAFGDKFSLHGMLCAEKIARVLERDILLERSKNEASFAASGMTFGSIAHELYNQLSSVDAQSLLVSDLLKENDSISESGLEDARKNAKTVYSEIQKAIETTESLRGIRGEVKSVSIQSCLNRAVLSCARLIGEFAKHHEDIEIEVPEKEQNEEWLVKAVPASLIIVFFNLYVNAVQQMELIHQFRKRGRVWHSLERREDQDGKHWAFVRIHDTGPGIHPEDWEHVFEPGYSTKENGTGLGLYICRHLLSSIHESKRYATLKITNSILWDGTTFTVKLPLVS